MAKFLDYNGLVHYTSCFKPTLVDLVDSGAKNLIPITRDDIKAANPAYTWNGYTATVAGLSFTVNEDLSVTISGTTPETPCELILLSRSKGVSFLPNGDYVISGGYPRTYGSILQLGVNRTSGGSATRYATYIGTPVEFTVSDAPAANGVWIGITNDSPGLQINATVKPMICTKSAWNISQKFVPYRPTYEETVEQVAENENNISSQQNTVAQGGNGYAIINGVRQYTGDTVTPPVPPNSLWLKDSVKVKTDNYFNVDDFSAIQVDAQGNKRCGTNCGILPQGTYTLSATTSAPQNALFHTIKSGTTYTLVTIDSLPYTFTADGVSEQIIRVANATTTSWGENGYTDIMLNTGSTAQNYTPYWTDVIDEKINPLENNILMLETMNGAKNLMHYDSIDDTRTTGTITATLNSDMTITINGTSGDTPAVIGFVFPLKSGEYWLNGCPTDGSFETYCTDIRNQIYGSIIYGRDTGSGATVNISDDGNYAYNIRIAANTTINNMIFRPMLISSDIKNAGFTNYQPYAMSNTELTNNISFVQQMNGKSPNLVNTYNINKIKSLNPNGVWINNTYTSTNNGSITINTDGTITVDGNFTAGTTFNLQLLSLENGDYYFSGCPLGGSAGAQNGYFLAIKFQRNGTQYIVDVGNGNFYTKVDGDTDITLQLWVRPQTNINNKLWKIYLVSKAAYDSGYSNYQPYALSNAQLTAEEQQNEDNILTLADSFGTKNLLNVTFDTIKALNISGTWTNNVFSHDNGGIFTVNSDLTIDVDTTNSTGNNYFWIGDVNINSSIVYVLSGSPSGGANNTYFIKINDTSFIDTGNSINVTGISTGRIVIGVLAGTRTTLRYKPMVCLKTMWDISHTYQPYSLTNAELTAKEQQNESNILTVADQTTRYNLLNQAAYTELRNVTYNNGVVTQVNADTRSNLVMQLSLYNGSTFVTQLAQATVTTNGIVSIPFTYSQEGNLIRMGHSGANTDARIVYSIPTDFVVNGKYYFVCTVNNCKQFIDGVTTPYSWQNMAIIPKAIYDSGFTSYQLYAMSNAELTAREQQNENNISSITPRTVMYTYTPTATDTYELIPQFTVTLPANKTICITAAGYRNGNNKITGVQIQQSNTQDTENVIGIAESNTLYRCLTATGTYKNTSNANTTINVYIKCDAAGVLHNCNIFYWII